MMKTIKLGKDESRYSLRPAADGEIPKLRMKFPDLREHYSILVVEREGVVVGALETASLVFIHDLRLSDQDRIKRGKTLIATLELLKETADNTGVSMMGFCPKSDEPVKLDKNGKPKLHGVPKLIDQFYSKTVVKTRPSKGRFYSYH